MRFCKAHPNFLLRALILKGKLEPQMDWMNAVFIGVFHLRVSVRLKTLKLTGLGETPNTVSLVLKNQKIEPQMNRMNADG